MIPAQRKRLTKHPSEQNENSTHNSNTKMNVTAGYSVANNNSRIFYGENHPNNKANKAYSNYYGIFERNYTHGKETYSCEIINEKVNTEISPSQIIIKDELNKIGEFKADINFHSEVKANIVIKIDKIQSK